MSPAVNVDDAEDAEKVAHNLRFFDHPRVTPVVQSHRLLQHRLDLYTVFGDLTVCVAYSSVPAAYGACGEMGAEDFRMLACTFLSELGASVPRAVACRSPAAFQGLEGFRASGMLADHYWRSP